MEFSGGCPGSQFRDRPAERSGSRASPPGHIWLPGRLTCGCCLRRAGVFKFPFSSVTLNSPTRLLLATASAQLWRVQHVGGFPLRFTREAGPALQAGAALSPRRDSRELGCRGLYFSMSVAFLTVFVGKGRSVVPSGEERGLARLGAAGGNGAAPPRARGSGRGVAGSRGRGVAGGPSFLLLLPLSRPCCYFTNDSVLPSQSEKAATGNSSLFGKKQTCEDPGARLAAPGRLTWSDLKMQRGGDGVYRPRGDTGARTRGASGRHRGRVRMDIWAGCGDVGEGHGPCLSPRAALSDPEGTGASGEQPACVGPRGEREGTAPWQARGLRA